MRARVSKWGNSLAIRLPHAAVKSLRVHEGDRSSCQSTAIGSRSGPPGHATGLPI